LLIDNQKIYFISEKIKNEYIFIGSYL